MNKAQKESLASTRAAKAAAKQPIPMDEPAADHETLNKTSSGFDFVGYMNEHFALPSWKRSLIALVASGLTAYLTASTVMSLTSLLVTAALTATSSMFLSTLIFIVGAIAAVYAAIKAGQKVGMYIATGDIDRDLSRAYNWTKNLVSPRMVTVH